MTTTSTSTGWPTLDVRIDMQLFPLVAIRRPEGITDVYGAADDRQDWALGIGMYVLEVGATST